LSSLILVSCLSWLSWSFPALQYCTMLTPAFESNSMMPCHGIMLSATMSGYIILSCNIAIYGSGNLYFHNNIPINIDNSLYKTRCSITCSTLDYIVIIIYHQYILINNFYLNTTIKLTKCISNLWSVMSVWIVSQLDYGTGSNGKTSVCTTHNACMPVASLTEQQQNKWQIIVNCRCFPFSLQNNLTLFVIALLLATTEYIVYKNYPTKTHFVIFYFSLYSTGQCTIITHLDQWLSTGNVIPSWYIKLLFLSYFR
jgi:hypothetical protein